LLPGLIADQEPITDAEREKARHQVAGPLAGRPAASPWGCASLFLFLVGVPLLAALV
jgi:hypothetical protein